MKELIEELEKEFKHTPTYTLGDITHKIAIISKVRDSRYGQRLTFRDYDEVTPKKTDAFGVAVPSSSGEELGEANERVIKVQTLNEGDLLISYRGKYRYAVARVGNNYKRTIVGNNSTIRIQFNDNINKEIPILVQAYLQQEYVQNYLKRCSADANFSRQLINAEMLATLPLPNFTSNADMPFSEFHNMRLSLLDIAIHINETSKDIIEKTTESANADIALHTNQPNLLKELTQKDKEMLEYLESVRERLDGFKATFF